MFVRYRRRQLPCVILAGVILAVPARGAQAKGAGRPTASPAEEGVTRKGEVSKVDVAVLRAVLDSVRSDLSAARPAGSDGSLIVFEDSVPATEVAGFFHQAVDPDSTRRWKALLNAWLMRNSRPVRLTALNREEEIHLLRGDGRTPRSWETFHAQYPGAQAVAWLSLPGYSPDGLTALVYVRLMGAHASSAELVRLKKEKANWKRAEVLASWTT